MDLSHVGECEITPGWRHSRNLGIKVFGSAAYVQSLLTASDPAHTSHVSDVGNDYSKVHLQLEVYNHIDPNYRQYRDTTACLERAIWSGGNSLVQGPVGHTMSRRCARACWSHI